MCLFSYRQTWFLDLPAVMILTASASTNSAGENFHSDDEPRKVRNVIVRMLLFNELYMSCQSKHHVTSMSFSSYNHRVKKHSWAETLRMWKHLATIVTTIGINTVWLYIETFDFISVFWKRVCVFRWCWCWRDQEESETHSQKPETSCHEQERAEAGMERESEFNLLPLQRWGGGACAHKPHPPNHAHGVVSSTEHFNEL